MILIADDEKAIAKSIAQNLQWAMPEMKIESRFDGNSALEEIRRGGVTLLITDYMMPGMNGIDLIAETKLLFPITSVILMTGYGRPDLKVHALRLGSAYVEKPFQMKTFIELARSLCRARHFAAENSPGAGVIHGASLDDLIQSYSFSRLDRTLVVVKDEQIGTVFLRAGRIAHAETGCAVGIKALAAMIGWKFPNIDVHEGYLTDRQTIHSPSSQDALLEAIRLAGAHARTWLGDCPDKDLSQPSVTDLLNQMGVTEEHFTFDSAANSRPLQNVGVLDRTPATPVTGAFLPPAMSTGKETWLEQVTRVMQEIGLEMPELTIAELIVENRDRIVGMSAVPYAGAAPPQTQGVTSLLRSVGELMESFGAGALESAMLFRPKECVVLAAVPESRDFLAAETPQPSSWKMVLVSLRAWAQRIQKIKAPAH